MEKFISKKNLRILLVVALVISSAFLVTDFFPQLGFSNQPENNLKTKQPANQQEANLEQTKQIELTATKSGQTPFSLLIDKRDVEYDQYEAGVFVTAINDLSANDNYYWAFYVNGQYAQKAADQVQLESGDQVKWVYEQIDQAEFEEQD
jgi:hypothetical protein